MSDALRSVDLNVTIGVALAGVIIFFILKKWWKKIRKWLGFLTIIITSLLLYELLARENAVDFKYYYQNENAIYLLRILDIILLNLLYIFNIFAGLQMAFNKKINSLIFIFVLVLALSDFVLINFLKNNYNNFRLVTTIPHFIKIPLKNSIYHYIENLFPIIVFLDKCFFKKNK